MGHAGVVIGNYHYRVTVRDYGSGDLASGIMDYPGYSSICDGSVWLAFF